jgi:hypothetical protein
MCSQEKCTLQLWESVWAFDHISYALFVESLRGEKKIQDGCSVHSVGPKQLLAFGVSFASSSTENERALHDSIRLRRVGRRMLQYEVHLTSIFRCAFSMTWWRKASLRWTTVQEIVSHRMRLPRTHRRWCTRFMRIRCTTGISCHLTTIDRTGRMSTF